MTNPIKLFRVECALCGEAIVTRPDTNHVLICPYCHGNLIACRTARSHLFQTFSIDADATYWEFVVGCLGVELMLVVAAKNFREALEFIEAAVNCDDVVVISHYQIAPEDAAKHLVGNERPEILNFGF